MSSSMHVYAHVTAIEPAVGGRFVLMMILTFQAGILLYSLGSYVCMCV